MNATEFNDLLNQLFACADAKEWAAGKDFEIVWKTCDRGDWMLWLANKMQDKTGWGDFKNRTLAKVKCARLVQHLMKDKRSINALDIAEAFANGNATREELNAAAADAAAADAADAAYAAYAAARKETLKKCADICREILITPLNIHKP